MFLFLATIVCICKCACTYQKKKEKSIATLGEATAAAARCLASMWILYLRPHEILEPRIAHQPQHRWLIILITVFEFHLHLHTHINT